MMFLMYSVTKNANMNANSNRNELLVTFKGVKYGAFAGFVATWSISSVIVVTELLLGLNIGAFYSIIGVSLGITDITAATSIAFGLHLLVGTIIGAVFGAIGIRWKKIRMLMLNPYKSSLVGMGAGIILWLVLFLPITLFLVQPAINSITTILAIGSRAGRIFGRREPNY